MCLIMYGKDLEPKAVNKDKKVQNHKRNNEKRKEKCRDAARCRRSRETEIFTDLSKALPLPQDQVSQLDKASVMRLAISYLKVRDMIKLVPEADVVKDEQELTSEESIVLKSLDGFVIAMSDDGDFVYVSDNVSDFLGITQMDLMGQNVSEYSHPCDHDEIKDILSAKSQEAGETSRSFFLRLKCTLTSKGRSVNLKSATYKVIQFTGHMLQETVDDDDSAEGASSNSNVKRCLVAVGRPIPHPSNIEAPLPRQTFLTKHNLDMTFTYADDKMMEFLGYESEDLIGKSIYAYSHAVDTQSIISAYKCLFSKGQTETTRYRFLAKTGGYAWVLTQATLIYDKVQKPQSVVCVNYVISEIECKDEIYSEFQLACAATSEEAPPAEVKFEAPNSQEEEPAKCLFAPSIPTVELTIPEDEESQPKLAESKPITVTEKLFQTISSSNNNNNNNSNSKSNYLAETRPQTATSKIFAPRTEDMSKGYLTFSDEEPGLTLLKDEPEDLTHLAPEAGEVVSLGDRLFGETFMNLMAMNKDDSLSGMGQGTDSALFDSFFDSYPSIIEDPFIYRSDSSPQMLSPDLPKSSECSLQSLNSPADSLSDEDPVTTFLSLPMDEDLELKAPYISMTMGDDLPLILTNDLMWSANDPRPLENPDPPETTSSLAQLLSSGVNSKRPIVKSNDHGGTMIQNNNTTDFYEGKGRANWDIPKTVGHKRLGSYDATSSKRTKCEPKEMTSELLQQLMSNNTHSRSRPVSKGKRNWLLDGSAKAACVSQPSESVLMNLLVSGFDIRAGYICLAPRKKP